MHKIKFAALLLSLCLLMQPIAAVKADDVNIAYTVLETGSSFIQIPMIAGLEDSEVEERINTAMIVDGGFSAYEAIFNSLTDSNETGIQLKAEAKILGECSGLGLLTVKIEASGRIGPGRPGHRVTALMYDLESGERVSAGDLFKDIEQTQSALDELVGEEIEPWMSDYLTPDELYPIPLDNLLLDEAGMTFYYDQSRFDTLSNRSGAVSFHYDELLDLLTLDEGSVLNKIGLLTAAEDTRFSVQAAMSLGTLPGLPIKIGEKTQEVLLNFPSLYDSEAFPTGERYQLEDARFRGSWLISDGEYVTGILSHRLNLFGMITGESTLQEVADALGEPQSSMFFDENAAISYGLSPGRLDSYEFGDNTLYFNYDIGDILQAIWLNQLI